MKFAWLFFIFTFSQGPLVNAQGLHDYQWKNRVLLLLDTANESRALSSQWSKYGNQKPQLNERDLLVFRVTDTVLVQGHNGAAHSLSAKAIRHDLDIPEEYRGVILVGKDGGIKYRGTLETPPQVIFDKIDAMPMRQAEMRTD